MGLLDRISDVAARVIPTRDIEIDGELYLRRFFLTPRSWPVRLFLHHMRRSDAGRFLHDHPWDFVSFVLWGSYDEALMNGKRHHRWLKFHRYQAKDTHAVRLPEGKQAVTLCLVRPAKRIWGFYTDEGWRTWRVHLGVPESVPTPLEDRIKRVA